MNNFTRLSKYFSNDRSTPYATNLSPSDELEFNDWVKQNNIPFDPSPQSDYDMRGFYKAYVNNDPRAKSSISPVDDRIHFPDYWKTPLHQSFSNESIYATPDAPHWDGNKLVDKDGNVIHVDLPQ